MGSDMNLDDLISLYNDGGMTGPEGADSGDPGLLEKNLVALAVRSPGEADQIRRCSPRLDVEFIESEEGLSATLYGVALASKRRPLSEAKKLAASVDPEEVAISGVIGFGLGYHCAELLKRTGPRSIMVCFEPDVALVRSVLSRVDCSELFLSGRFFLVCDAQDRVQISSIFTGNEALVGMGVRLIAHPASASRLGNTGDAFGQIFSNALGSARTHVVTTLANSRVSFRNAIMNLDHYVRTGGIRSLKDACAGKPAIVVSAGPSLEKNLDLLGEPGVRDRFVIIAVQTVLKPMLAKGIRPHFVAALDYHEVSGRFYEGLSAEDVRGVRLIAEPKANPVILDAFPGEVLCPHDPLLDTLLGEELARDRGNLPMGGTVAHLCYSFARYLGCDPVVLIGQDLGFSDGQYYASGAAIHNVWGSELSAHRTLEMFEWERVARMRANLHRREDIHGNPIYTDEQMCSYLAQFEGMFAEDTRRGLRVIDASEGGVLKRHTEVMALRDVLSMFGTSSRGLAEVDGVDAHEDVDDVVLSRVERVVRNCEQIATISERSIDILEEMLRDQQNQTRVAKLINKVNRNRDEVMKMRDAFTLVEYVNQIAVLNRMKRDRVIDLRSVDAEPMERQRLQIERDIENVKWIRDAARAVALQLRDGLGVLRGTASKQTTDMRESDEVLLTDGTPRPRDRVHAMVLADPELGGLGTRRSLDVRLLPESAGGLNVLQTTIARLDRCEELDAITVVTPDAQGVRQILGAMPTRLTLDVVEVDAKVIRSHTARIGAARVQSSTSWRGSLGLLCVFDEIAQPGLFAHVMQTRGIDAAALVGADWAMIDPGLVDQTIGRLRRQSSEKRIAFSQACVGLGTMVVDRNTMQSIAESAINGQRRNPMATMGALLSYLPIAPQADPIVRGVCVQVDPALRDAGLRGIADSSARYEAMRTAYATMDDPMGCDALGAVRALAQTGRPSCPATLVIETCTGRLMGGDWGRWKRGSLEAVERTSLSLRDAHSMIRQLCDLREDAAVVFDGVGDPLMHPDMVELIGLAKEDGAACVEMRTDLLREGVEASTLIESGLDVLSVDVIADNATAYRALSAVDGYNRVCDRLQSIHDAIGAGDEALWLAARLTRCEATLDQVEPFYDKWLMLTGCAVIDPLPGFVHNQRIARIPVPQWRQKQMERDIMRVRCDGVVIDQDGHPVIAQGSEINAIDEGIERAYQRLRGSVRAAELEIKLGVKESAA